jgi:multiple sugar transport system permease protein
MNDAMRAAPAVSAAARPRASATGAGQARRALIYLALGAGALTMIFPFAWMVSTSLTSDAQLFATPPRLIPEPAQPENYARVFETFPIGRFALNSAIVAVASTALQLLTSAMGAYAFARIRFPGREALFVVYLATLMIPMQVLVVPLFIEMRLIGQVNSYGGLILPGIASAFGTFLLRQYFLTLPVELEEAALMDGASRWSIFLRIVLPLSGPALATFGVFAFMASWNAFLWPLLVVSDTEMMTLPVGLSNLRGRFVTEWNLVMAGATVSVIPIVMVYLAAQRYVVRGIALSGIKG